MKSILPMFETARSTMQALYGPKVNTSGPPERHSVAKKETRSFQDVAVHASVQMPGRNSAFATSPA
ncbi:hypothetical protein, partial [Paraburkholderia caledonica]|uniref:hypothetical protein n=1 Tax=Paraburkholderia caledonica TaxID=134536 RepID=UPI003CA8B983